MNLLLKKTWLVFFILAFSGLSTFILATYLKHNELENNLQTEQRYVTKLFDAHISSAFFQFETLLELISYEYTSQQNLNLDVIDNILAKNPLLVGFALFNTDGEFKQASSNLRSASFSNLLNSNETKNWFKLALTQDQMTVGRPYYLKPLQTWIIPIRKRILNADGEVIGVISSGLDLQASMEKWDKDSNPQRILQATLDNDFYRVFRTNTAFDDYQEIYNTPIKAILISKLQDQLAEKNLTLEILRHSQKTIQLQAQREQQRYTTLLFNSELRLWISATESNDALHQRLLPQMLTYGTFYLLFLVVIFFLFKWIIRIEKSKIKELTYRAEHDLLTGLFNRSILKDKHFNYNKHPFSLLYIDLDHFNGINDSYGYSYGDAILVEVSKRIKKSAKGLNSTAIRLSADEFILIIESTDKSEIKEYSLSLLNAINTPYLINNNDFKISASIGIAQSPTDAVGIESLISYANNSMLIAKKTKNHFVFFSEKIHQQLINNIEIERALHSAVAKNEISIVYQPQLDNRNQLCGVEALVRWHNESLGFISPDKFIPIAEEIGLMPEIGAYIMNKAMADISALQCKKEKAFQLSINVSARQFVQLNFFEALLDCIARHKSPYLKITIEITESLFIENIERLLPIFQKMKAEDISLSLDDFGTGYSSLSMLRNVPIDELKIDKSFVDHIVNNDNDCAMVASIITMGKNLGMAVLAEGVEDEQQASILKNAGCDLYQGYYFSKPLHLADLEKYIDTL